LKNPKAILLYVIEIRNANIAAMSVDFRMVLVFKSSLRCKKMRTIALMTIIPIRVKFMAARNGSWLITQLLMQDSSEDIIMH